MVHDGFAVVRSSLKAMQATLNIGVISVIGRAVMRAVLRRIARIPALKHRSARR